MRHLSPRQKEVILRRFGFQSDQKETLESIGKDFRITRERVRQIERDGFSKMEPKIEKYKNTFNYLTNYFQRQGELKREDILFSQLAGSRFQPHLRFLLAFHPQCLRIAESKEFYPLWTINQNSLKLAREINNTLISKFREKEKTLSFLGVLGIYKTSSLSRKKNLNPQALLSFVEISKEIEKGVNNLFGLKDWPEINPRGVKDRIFLALKKERQPTHFYTLATLISKLPFPEESDGKKKKIVSQTVHNELIKDSRFVLVGRGMYALREWGYEPGVVRDVIEQILREKKKANAKRGNN